MGIRRAVSSSLNRVVGPDRTRALRSAEANLRTRLIRALDVEGEVKRGGDVEAIKRDARRAGAGAARKADAEKRLAKSAAPVFASRQAHIDAIGARSEEGVSHRDPKKMLPWVKPDPHAEFPLPEFTRHSLLSSLHERFLPRTYLEIGVSRGDSLVHSRTTSIGVDPEFTVINPLHCNLRLFRETSDDFFKLPDAFEHFGGLPLDLAFIDGMHLAEYVLRDFINTEKQMSRSGVVILDDMLPRNSLEAFRIRRTNAWTGDVYKVHEVLRQYRPDLTIVPISTLPTGSYLIAGLDPESTVLEEKYDEIEATLLGPDPQVVSQEWLERRTAVAPDQVVGLDIWGQLASSRDKDLTREELDVYWAQLRALPTIWG